MNYNIDTKRQKITVNGKIIDLFSDESFNILSDLWVKIGWNQKYSYSFSWLGAPIIQMPEDMIRFQEVVFKLKPDVIIETGVAHGGSVIFSASLCQLMGKGHVVGIDIDIRDAARKRVQENPMSSRITLIEGSSTAPSVIDQVSDFASSAEVVLVVLDSDHSYQHVSDELEAYSPLVSVGSYIIATDGLMKDLADVPRGAPSWKTDNPATAAIDFAAQNQNFRLEQPAWVFNESTLTRNITHWPDSWLRRLE